MDTPLDSLLFYTKLLTGLVILLNFSSLASVFLLTRWLRHPEKALQLPEGAEAGGGPWLGMSSPPGDPVYRPGARAILLVLLLSVIAVNGLALLANANLREATDSVVLLFGGA